MAKKREDGYLSGREARRIQKENRRIINEFEKKRKRKNVPESEYLTTMHDPGNAVEFDDLHTFFFTDSGTVHSVDGVTFSVPIGKTVGVVGEDPHIGLLHVELDGAQGVLRIVRHGRRGQRQDQDRDKYRQEPFHSSLQPPDSTVQNSIPWVAAAFKTA